MWVLVLSAGKILPGGSRFHEGDLASIFCREGDGRGRGWNGRVLGESGKRWGKGRVNEITKVQKEKAEIPAPRCARGVSDVSQSV